MFGDNGAKLIEIRKDGTEILRAIYSATDKKVCFSWRGGIWHAVR